ncbi:MAG: 50S ribosomal protein L10 [Clostridiaceae bacterium]|nr:50S ribosomal protein L10 [Clostridiaceae bacterium]
MPSEKILAQKQKQVAELAEQFRAAQSVVVMEFVGLTVEEDTELRTELRKQNVNYQVIKNTIASRAVTAAGLADLVPLFFGSTSVAWSADDAVAPAKILRRFARKFAELKLKGGAVEGKALTLEEIMRVAEIPSVEELYAKIVGSLISPIAGLAIILKAIAEKMEAEGKKTAGELVGKAGSAPAEPVGTEAEEPAAAEESVAAEAETEEPAAE